MKGLELSKKYYKEYYDLNNTGFYISSGMGTSTINFRWFNKLNCFSI